MKKTVKIRVKTLSLKLKLKVIVSVGKALLKRGNLYPFEKTYIVERKLT